MPNKTTHSKKANTGEKLIHIRISFWTNNIAAKDNEIVPKHCFDAGLVNFERNDSHGITPSKKGKTFNSLLELPAVIEKVLIDHRIRVHLHRKSLKYYDTKL